jgi:hypothetical protein
VARAGLTAAERDRMYALLSAYFARTSRDRFEADLVEKESVVLLRDHHAEIQGFSTFMRIEASLAGADNGADDGTDVVAFFSGDTIVAQPYWGETTLSRLWSQAVFAEADRIVARRPSAQVYWFLICSGYKTFRFLPVFFRDFYPNPETGTPPGIKRVLDALGQAKFGEHYDASSGIVRFPDAARLREGVAEVTEQRLRDPLVAFFASMNPGHAEGDELACLTRISRTNLTRAGERMVGPRAASTRVA